MNKILYPNSTQVANFVLNNQSIFTDGELRVLLAITRKTVGWHKETDFLRYTQIIEITGKSKPVISEAVIFLVKTNLIVRLDSSGKEIKKMPQGFRGKVFYSLNKNLNIEANNEERLVKKINQSRILTSTGKESLPYKTNSNKTNIIGGATKLNNKKNVDKSVDNIRVTDNGLTRIKFDTLKTKPYKFKNEDLFLAYSKTKITTHHQAWGYLAVDELDLPISLLPRVIKSFKGKNYVDIKNAISKITSHTKLRSANDRVKYLFKII